MKHGLNTDQDRGQGIGKEEEEEEGEEAADGNAGQQLFFTDKTRSQQEVRKRYAPSFRHLTFFLLCFVRCRIRVHSVFHPWL